MLPICCQCNASGSCRNCSCKKVNRHCSNCLPFHRGHCLNSGQQFSQLPPHNAPVSNLDTLQSPANEDAAEVPQQAEMGSTLAPDLDLATINVTPPSPSLVNPSTITDLPHFTPLSTPTCTFRWGDMVVKRLYKLSIAVITKSCIGDGTSSRYQLAKRSLRNSHASFKLMQMTPPLKA